MDTPRGKVTRRRFIRETAAGTVAVAGTPAMLAGLAPDRPDRHRRKLPWYRRAYLWGQTNITEKDPVRYDIDWWRGYWKRTRGAGRHHQRRRHRRLLPEQVSAAPSRRVPRRPRSVRRADESRARRRPLRDGADGLESHRRGLLQGAPRLVRARPSTASRIAPPTSTSPASTVRTTTSTCPTSCARSSSARIRTGSPTTAGPGSAASSICYCDNCARKFQREDRQGRCRGQADWDDPAYRDWILWNYARRIEVWELNNRTTRAAGGPDCIWSGMNSGSVTAQARSFRDLREICRARRHRDARPPAARRRHRLPAERRHRQARARAARLGQAGAGVDGDVPVGSRLLPRREQARGRGPDVDDRRHRRRHPAVVAPRRRLPRRPPHVPHRRAGHALVEGATSGISSTARRSRTSASSGRSGTPISSGATMPASVVDAPYTGFMHALVRARIPYLPVHVDDIERDAASLRVADPPERRRAVGRAGGRRSARFVAARRIAARDRRDRPLQRVGRSAARLRARRSVRAVIGRRCRRRVRGTRRRPIGRRVCAEPERSHLPAAQPGTARPGRRSASRRRAAGRGRAPPGAARLRRNGHPARSAASLVADESRRRRDGAAHVRAGVPDLSAGDGVDAAAEDRHSRPRAVSSTARRAWPTCPRTSIGATRGAPARSRATAGQHRSLGRGDSTPAPSTAPASSTAISTSSPADRSCTSSTSRAKPPGARRSTS